MGGECSLQAVATNQGIGAKFIRRRHAGTHRVMAIFTRDALSRAQVEAFA